MDICIKDEPTAVKKFEIKTCSAGRKNKKDRLGGGASPLPLSLGWFSFCNQYEGPVERSH